MFKSLWNYTVSKQSTTDQVAIIATRLRALQFALAGTVVQEPDALLQQLLTVTPSLTGHYYTEMETELNRLIDCAKLSERRNTGDTRWMYFRLHIGCCQAVIGGKTLDTGEVGTTVTVFP